MLEINKTKLIVMLTHNDYTVKNAFEIFEQSKNSKAEFWGLKEKGLPLKQMKSLYAYIKKSDKTTVLEVAAYTENECMEGARMALGCKCDILMGTVFFDSVNKFCKENNLKYMPFVGKVTNRPSVLEGDIEEIIKEANICLEKGVYGFDLLGYRYLGDAINLNRSFLSRLHAPICLAGGIDSYEKLDEINKILPWAFTIGTAFFENKFGEDYEEQINKVCEYIDM